MNQSSRNDGFPAMENMTVKTVREYLRRKTSVIIPVGCTEQHGYHLPLKTDTLIATRLAGMIGSKTGTLVAPTISMSFSGGGLPGTINLPPATVSLVLNDMLISLVSQGFRNLYVFLGHGESENTRALTDGVKVLLRTNPAFEKVMIVLMPVWEFDPNRIGWKKALAENDWHAGWLETSMVMALEPDLVRMDELELDDEPYLGMQREHPDNYQHAESIVDDKLVVPRLSQRREINVGVMGYPRKASAELGRRIIDDTVTAAADKITEIESRADGVYKEILFTPDPLIF